LANCPSGCVAAGEMKAADKVVLGKKWKN